MKRINNLKPLTANNCGVLVYTPVSRYYLTGFTSSLGYLFITETENTLLVDGRYFEAAQKSVSGDIKVLPLKNLKEDASEPLRGIKRIFTETEIKVSELDFFKKSFEAEVLAEPKVDKILGDMRLIKTDFEIECIKKAEAITEAAFDYILEFIKPGVTEGEIAAALEYKMKLLGSSEPSFGTIAISGEKTSMPHGVPGERRVNLGEFVTMDFGAVYGGYHSDMTRTVAVGRVSDEMEKVYNTVLKANLAGLDAVKAGTLCSEADKASRDVISAAGYGDFFTHSLGHGVGLEIHEAPNLSPKCSLMLEAGQVVTVEPGIYLPGKFGVRIEDMVVVTKNGCKNLTKAPKQFIII